MNIQTGEKFHSSLLDILKKDNRFFTDDGKPLLNVIYEATTQMDEGLIRLLLEHDITRDRFFKTVNGVYVFDKTEFGWTVNNKQFLPDSYTRYKNKIGLAKKNGELISASSDVDLVFPYKDCVLEGGQTKEDQKKDEIFYNETLCKDEIDHLLYPKVFVNAKRYSANGEEVITSFEDTDNIVIKGNNLLALSSLLKRYGEKVKCIYIDPPFNTGKDSFNYNDKFTRSTWLTFMRNRLELAKQLLTRDGNIFIHIDINQSHYLKVLADEIFGEDNFIEEIIWAYGSPSGGRAASAKPVNVHDYILHYSKDKSSHKQNRIYVPYSEKYIKDWFKYTDDDGRVYQKRQRGTDEMGNAIWEKQYLDESKGVPLSTVWTDILQVYADPRAYKEGNTADVEVIKIFKGGQKPEALIQRIFEMSTDEGDIILDFHLGTGTSAAVAHKINRRYIGIEQIDSQIDIIIERLRKVIKGDTSGISKRVKWQGGGSFIYCELAELNQKFVKRIESASNENISAHWEDIQTSGFISTKINPKDIDTEAEEFSTLSLDDKKRFLMEVLDKNMLYVNYCDIDDTEYAISESDKSFTHSFYGRK